MVVYKKEYDVPLNNEICCVDGKYHKVIRKSVLCIVANAKDIEFDEEIQFETDAIETATYGFIDGIYYYSGKRFNDEVNFPEGIAYTCSIEYVIFDETILHCIFK